MCSARSAARTRGAVHSCGSMCRILQTSTATARSPSPCSDKAEAARQRAQHVPIAERGRCEASNTKGAITKLNSFGRYAVVMQPSGKHSQGVAPIAPEFTGQMDLIAGYGSSSSESDGGSSDSSDMSTAGPDSSSKKRKPEVVAASAPGVPAAAARLPTASDLLSTVPVRLPSAAALFSSVGVLSTSAAASPYVHVSIHEEHRSTATIPASASSISPRLMPPQIRRPNISTEDSSSFNTSVTAEKARDAAAAAASKAAAKGKKDPLSFNQKEKRKRDLGQSSRAKNFVEEEKRMLRQFGSS